MVEASVEQLCPLPFPSLPACHTARAALLLPAGGHNVIIGLHDYLQRWHPGSTLVGFLGGPRGVMQNKYKVLTAEELDGYRNQGGFHLIGSGRDKIEKPEQLAAAAQACATHNLDGLVIIGGDGAAQHACAAARQHACLEHAARCLPPAFRYRPVTSLQLPFLVPHTLCPAHPHRLQHQRSRDGRIFPGAGPQDVRGGHAQDHRRCVRQGGGADRPRAAKGPWCSAPHPPAVCTLPCRAPCR